MADQKITDLVFNSNPASGDLLETVDVSEGTNEKITLNGLDDYLKSTTKTLTNKTIDADNNTVSNLEIGNEVSKDTLGNFGVNGELIVKNDTMRIRTDASHRLWFEDEDGTDRGILYHNRSYDRLELRHYSATTYRLLWVNSIDGEGGCTCDFIVDGSLSKGSGSFKIDHPLKPLTHELVHSFVESPQADNIYSGMVTLKNGKAEVNIDQASGMTEGTFEALNRDIRRMTTNESGFTAIKSKIEGNILIIEAEDSVDDEVFWQVIGERQDKHMFNTKWTDENGKVIVEPEKEEIDPVEFEDREEEVEDVEKVGEEDEFVDVGGKKGYYRHPEAFGVNQEFKRKVKKVLKKKK